MDNPEVKESPKAVLLYDPESGGVAFNMDATFPPDKLVNALELMKIVAVNQQLRQMEAHRMAQQRVNGILMPDGTYAPPTQKEKK
jgi:hypothetical protein